MNIKILAPDKFAKITSGNNIDTVKNEFVRYKYVSLKAKYQIELDAIAKPNKIALIIITTQFW